MIGPRGRDPDEAILRSLNYAPRAWYLWTATLLILVVLGFVAYVQQWRHGLAVTGMRDDVTWGLYISNFVFFSGLSMAGTFISAILRMTEAEWRRPLTRLAELSTVSALVVCAVMPFVDMGRPDRLLYLFRYPHLTSPLMWDILVIPTYLAASALYLYLFLIPDAAALRDDVHGPVSAARRRLYRIVAAGWQGRPDQRRRLERGAAILTLLIIPLGVATHSVVSWIFGMTFRAGWSSTIFAPYFAVGALYSGTALLITLMAVFRRAYHLESYFTNTHFQYLARLMASFGALYVYFTFAEYLSAVYKLEGGEGSLLQQLFVGRYSALVWSSFGLGQVIPLVVVAIPRLRTIPLLFVASLLANYGMWIKRFVIVVPSLALPLMPYQWGVYSPTWVEILITGSSFGAFALVITLFARLFPIVSLWEMDEGREVAKAALRSLSLPVRAAPQ